MVKSIKIYEHVIQLIKMLLCANTIQHQGTNWCKQFSGLPHQAPSCTTSPSHQKNICCGQVQTKLLKACLTCEGVLNLHISMLTFTHTFHVEQRVQAKQKHITVLANNTKSHQAAQQTKATRNRLTSLFNLVPNNEVNPFSWSLSLATGAVLSELQKSVFVLSMKI